MSNLIRRALNSDLNDIANLFAQLGYSQKIDELKKRFELFSSQKDYGVVVAEQDNKIVGLVAWSMAMMLVVPKMRLRIEGLVIDAQYRHQGIAKKLMVHVEEFAKQFSPCVIEITSGMKRAKEGTHQFYEAIGYRNEGSMAKLYLRKEV